MEGSGMAFSITQLIEERQDDQYALHKSYINPSLTRVLGIIGFNKKYVRGKGAYLWDIEGNRYLDLLAAYGVFNLGRDHPVVNRVMQEVLTLERPTLVKMDVPLLSGLLAEELVKRMPPGLDAVFFANSGAIAVDTAFKFARAAMGRPRILFLDHAFHGLTLGTLPATNPSLDLPSQTSVRPGEVLVTGWEPRSISSYLTLVLLLSVS